MRNEGLRKEIKAAGACIWEIAEYMGISEMTVQRRLRKELSEGEVAAKLKSIFCGPIDWIKEKWSGVTEFFSGILGQVDKITERGAAVTGLKVTSVPGYASGSSYTPSTFIAGERGPELITGAQGSKVFTAIETGEIMSKMFNITDIFSRFGNLFDEPIAGGTSNDSGGIFAKLKEALLLQPICYLKKDANLYYSYVRLMY